VSGGGADAGGLAIQLGSLAVTIEPGRIALAGRIDDTARLASLLDRVAPGAVVIDAGGVVLVSSVGLREWARLVRALAARGPVTLERVPDLLMMQLGLIPALARDAQIASFRAPYLCPQCGAESEPLIDARAHAAALAALRAPELPCAECGGAAALAELPERFLAVFRAGG
jgi:hypothetical protein